MLARVSASRARMVRVDSSPRSVAQGSTGQVEEDVFQRGPADREVVRLDATRIGEIEQRADGGPDIARVDKDFALVGLDVDDRRKGLQVGCRDPGDRVEPYRPLLEAL